VRPLRLTVEGFTCFRTEQVLDFSTLTLFAIHGPTGAGKSSLLDAMIYALYGKVPRLKKGLTELVSLGRDRMSVTFDFRARQREYRVARVARRGRSAEAQLDEIRAGREQPVAGGVTRVDATIEAILGLRYDAFTQAVVLPQGEFARFLKSAPREQREILRDLLRLQVYERMRDKAAEEARLRSSQVTSLEERLHQDYGSVTEQAISELGARLEALEKENAARGRCIEQRQLALDEMKLLRQKTQELEEKEARACALTDREPEIVGFRSALESAAQAQGVIPIVEAALRALGESAAARERLERANQERDRARSRHRGAERSLAEARASAAAIPALEKRLRALHEVLGLLEPRDTLRQRLSEKRAQHQEWTRELEASAPRERELADKVGRGEKRLREATSRLASLEGDEALEARIDSVRESAMALVQRRLHAGRLSEEADRETERVRLKADEAAASEEALAATGSRLRAAAERVLELEAALREAERRDAVASLQREMRKSEPCPVCGEPVKREPPPVQLALLERPEAELEKAQKEEAAARAAVDKNTERAARARAEAREIGSRAESAAREVERAEQELAREERELERRVGGQVEGNPELPLEERVTALARRLTEGRSQRLKAARDRETIERELLRAQGEASLLSAQVKALAEKRDRLAREVAAVDEDLARIESRIEEVAGREDPRALVEIETERQRTLERALKEAEAREREAATARAAAEASFDVSLSHASEAEAGAREAGEKASAAAREAGFEDEHAVRRAALAPEDRQRFLEEVRHHEDESRAVSERVARLSAEIGDRRLTAEALQQAVAELSEARRLHVEGLQKEAAHRQEMTALEMRLKLARELAARLESERRDHGLYKQIADDLASHRFQAYLLEETFSDLVRGASIRLRQMSDRYTLEFENDAFHVLDHDNAGERRSADTLSGGETFLASLALALELSEQMQRAAGALQLDSLFIDEGFGTLDPETLDAVAAAIEKLPLGGRMVGIITHLPELTARLPARIQVEKRAQGSRVVPELA
jgi:exonuclease SbcC